MVLGIDKHSETRAKVEAITIQIEQLERRQDELVKTLPEVDENSIGVMLCYDYDRFWIVETLNDGEWEVDGSFDNYLEAKEYGISLSENLGVKIHIDASMPPKKYRKL